MSESPPISYRGTDRDLLGIVLAVLTFWLFAQSTLSIGPKIASDLGISLSLMSFAIAAAALFSGMLVIYFGGLGDQFGRVKAVKIGLLCHVVGSLLIAMATGPAAALMLITGRAFQGLSAAFILPSTMALIKSLWDGVGRQRAVSMWSIGSFGGSGFAAVFAGIMSNSALGWRVIYVLSCLVAITSFVLVHRIPDQAPASGRNARTDVVGIASLCLGLVALEIVISMGMNLGWTSAIVIGLLVVFVFSTAVFISTERRVSNPLVDFGLFKNRLFSGAVISNLLLNTTIGIISVTTWVLQLGAGFSTARAGYLTLGYAISIIAFIRVGERMMQRHGTQLPMLLGSVLIFIAITLLAGTTFTVEVYSVLVIIAFILFGTGLALFATPATDAALSSLPDEKAGTGSGIFKMASSLGGAFGIAVSASIFNSFAEGGSQFLGKALVYSGTQDNLFVREAAQVAFGALGVCALSAIVCILVFIPRTWSTP